MFCRQFFNKILITFSILIGVFFIFTPVLAKEPELVFNDESFSAKFVSQSIPDPIELEALEEKTVIFKFKNIGSSVWNGSGNNYVSAYTVEPKYRNSIFKSDSWISSKQTAKMIGKINPGEIGELVLKIKAPRETGDYIEKFYLASENKTWIKGGYFFIKIKVVPAKQMIEKESSVPEKNDVEKYLAKKVTQSQRKISAVGGRKIKMAVSYENIGSEMWSGYSLNGLSIETEVSGNIVLADSSWKSGTVVIEKNKKIKSGKQIKEVFYFVAPKEPGDYIVTFGLKTNNEIIKGSETEIILKVKAGSVDFVEPNFSDFIPVILESAPRLDAEPTIKVGLWKTKEPVEFISDNDDYAVFAGVEQKGIIPANEKVVLSFKNNQYIIKSASVDFSSDVYLRLEPVNDKRAVFTLLNFERKVSWKGPNNFNKYRGSLEYNLTSDGKNIYAINNILFEDYIAGIAETSNVSPLDYIKALLTAARTYAYYIKEYSDKHEERNFDVVAHTGDQLYLGYVSEKLMPRVAQAAEETKGYMVTYDNDIVITPYFANSNGKTKSWVDVWGGKEKPWLVSVIANYDQGKKLYGHGVGISAYDMACRADEEGLSWKKLLKYYYTGVEVKKMYK